MKTRFFYSVLILCLVLFACKKNDKNTPPANGAAVSITNFAFQASALTIQAGTSVTWTNNDATAHTVTADDNSYSSGTLSQGDTYSHTFTTAGTYAYHCKFHSMMTATITVQ